jgi:hypothetical protein
MRITCEIAIDLDEKRRIWMEAATEDVGLDAIEVVSRSLCQAVAKTALEVHEQVMPAHRGQSEKKLTETFD